LTQKLAHCCRHVSAKKRPE